MHGKGLTAKDAKNAKHAKMNFLISFFLCVHGGTSHQWTLAFLAVLFFMSLRRFDAVSRRPAKHIITNYSLRPLREILFPKYQ